MNKIQVIKTLAEVCEKILPLPKDSVLLGMGRDGLPVLFNVSNKQSPNVIVWDRIVGQGIRMIKVAIEFILRHKTGLHTEFVVISNRTKEWSKLTENELGVWNNNECVAVVPFWDVVCDQVLWGLAGWIHKEDAVKSPVVLFIDGLENVSRIGKDSQNWLRYITSCGRSKNIYVIACAESRNRESLAQWFDCFDAEVYGDPDKLNWLELDSEHKTILFFTPETTI